MTAKPLREDDGDDAGWTCPRDEKKKITNSGMVELMKPAAQVDRLLDPDRGSGMIESLTTRSRVVGRDGNFMPFGLYWKTCAAMT
jgi:hypothetical protein